MEKEEKKVFQAFNIRPLRQKLLTPAERDALNTRSSSLENKEQNLDQKSPDGPATPNGVYTHTPRHRFNGTE